MRISDWSSDVCSSDLAGDIYQANLTFRADVPVLGDPLAAYARLRRTARAGYGGFLWTGRQAIASLSPELFFALRGGQVVARPMKGRSEEHTSELQSLMRISYAVFCLKKKNKKTTNVIDTRTIS